MDEAVFVATGKPASDEEGQLVQFIQNFFIEYIGQKPSSKTILGTVYAFRNGGRVSAMLRLMQEFAFQAHLFGQVCKYYLGYSRGLALGLGIQAYLNKYPDSVGSPVNDDLISQGVDYKHQAQFVQFTRNTFTGALPNNPGAFIYLPLRYSLARNIIPIWKKLWKTYSIESIILDIYQIICNDLALIWDDVSQVLVYNGQRPVPYPTLLSENANAKALDGTNVWAGPSGNSAGLVGQPVDPSQGFYFPLSTNLIDFTPLPGVLSRPELCVSTFRRFARRDPTDLEIATYGQDDTPMRAATLLFNSVEGKQTLIWLAYQELYQRDPTNSEYVNWLASGLDIRTIRAKLMSADDFYQRIITTVPDIATPRISGIDVLARMLYAISVR